MIDPRAMHPPIRHVPMGALWSMPVAVACSLIVTAEGAGFSCGQCPLDRDGRVRAPGDLARQARIVADTCRSLLALAQDAGHAALAVIYHDAADDAGVAAATAPFRAALPGALILPVALPHFYYPGLRIEVDLYTTARPRPPLIQSHRGVTVARTAAGPLTLVTLQAEAGADAGAALAATDIAPGRLLAAHWFAPSAALPGPWVPDPAAAVLPRLPGAPLAALLILADEPVAVGRTPGGAHRRRAGRFVWCAAASDEADLAFAATRAMDAIGPVDGVAVKSTTHYAGGPTPEELHANLAVRHARFPRPGPASTGVPVAGLAGGTIAIDILSVLPQA
jgi:enamine deaminase RidA (YjgF/YER057c/UK114 family)